MAHPLQTVLAQHVHPLTLLTVTSLQPVKKEEIKEIEMAHPLQ